MTEIKEATPEQDLVERLRAIDRYDNHAVWLNAGLFAEAASALTAAQARIAELEATGSAYDEEAFDILQSKVRAAERERDEAQAQAYRLEKTIERYEDEAQKRRHWNDEAKRSRGYSVNVTFDTVWAETCAKADALAAAERERDEAQGEVDRLTNKVIPELLGRFQTAERERDEARAALKEVADEAYGRDSLDGYRRSSNELLRRLSRCYEIASAFLSPSASAVCDECGLDRRRCDRRECPYAPDTAPSASAFLGEDQTGVTVNLHTYRATQWEEAAAFCEAARDGIDFASTTESTSRLEGAFDMADHLTALFKEMAAAAKRAVLGGDQHGPNGPQTGATPAGWDERLSSLTTLVYPIPSPSEERYRQALEEVNRSAVKFVSGKHPQYAISEGALQAVLAALSPTQPEGGE